MKKNTSALIDAIEDVGLEENVQGPIYMAVSRHQNTEQNYDMNTRIANRFVENFSQFKYFGTRVIIRNFIPEKIKTRLNSDNAFYHLV
jgi:hypothetical protein